MLKRTSPASSTSPQKRSAPQSNLHKSNTIPTESNHDQVPHKFSNTLEDDHPYAIEVDDPPTPPGSTHGHPNTRNDGVGNIKIGGWETTLWCGCFKHCVPNCCMVTFCPSVTHAQISARLGMTPYWCALATLFTLVLLTGGTVHMILFVWIWKARALTRERFQIPGGCCRDCCASLFCPCCTLAQIATHIKSYQPGSCDFGPPDTLPAYSQT